MSVRVHYVLVRFPKLSETFVLREMLELERAGWAVSIDTLEDPLDEPRDPALAGLRARVRRVPDRPPLRRLLRAHAGVAARRPRVWLGAARRARRAGRLREFGRAGLIAARALRERADLLHVHFAYYSAEYAHDAAALAGLPFTVFAHANDIWAEDNARHLGRRLEGVAGVASVTAYNTEHLRAVAPGAAVEHLPLGVPAPTGRFTRAASGPVLAVARLVPKKGLDTFVEACAVAMAEARELRAEIVGDGPLLGELRELARARGIAERVVFRGALAPDGVVEAYGRCSLVVAPCRVGPDGDRDGLPTVLLEAMARGLPVIATDALGIPELVEHERNGLLVPPDDPEALAAAILRLRGDGALARRLGEEARRTVEEAYTLEGRSHEVRRWLEACARGGATPRV